MKTWKIVLLLFILLCLAGGAYLYLGIYNVAADEPHYAFTEDLIDLVKHRSIKARSFRIQVPENLDSAERRRRGAGNYDTMCVHCHLSPGVENTEIRKGLYPRPPDLTKHADAPAEQFWVIRHGVKMTGMPAWSKGGVDDETIWDMVALLQVLPELSAEKYRALVATSEGHSHADADDHPHGHAEPGNGDAQEHGLNDESVDSEQGDHDHDEADGHAH